MFKRKKKRSNTLPIVLAIIGTSLVLFPVLAPILFLINEFFTVGFQMFEHFNFDFLMPAELSMIALPGAILLFAASLIARSYRVWMIICFSVALVIIVGGQTYAVVTGLASGETEPGPSFMTILMILMAIYSLAHVAMGVGGILLARKLVKEK